MIMRVFKVHLIQYSSFHFSKLSEKADELCGRQLSSVDLFWDTTDKLAKIADGFLLQLTLKFEYQDLMDRNVTLLTSCVQLNAFQKTSKQHSSSCPIDYDKGMVLVGSSQSVENIFAMIDIQNYPSYNQLNLQRLKNTELCAMEASVTSLSADSFVFKNKLFKRLHLPCKKRNARLTTFVVISQYVYSVT